MTTPATERKKDKPPVPVRRSPTILTGRPPARIRNNLAMQQHPEELALETYPAGDSQYGREHNDEETTGKEDHWGSGLVRTDCGTSARMTRGMPSDPALPHLIYADCLAVCGWSARWRYCAARRRLCSRRGRCHLRVKR